MAIPVYLNGEPVGALTVIAEGLYTRVSLRLPLQERALRLYLHSGEQTLPLGVPVPEGDMLTLTRRFSRSELGTFPLPPERADENPGGSRPAVSPESAPAAEDDPAGHDWREAGRGTLLCRREGITYLALPCSLRRRCPGLRSARINGREYLIFRS